jgi:plastocyanin
MSDETEASESQGAEPEATASGSTAVAVLDEPSVPAVATGEPQVDPKVEQRKTRLWLPLLIPLGAIAVIALFTLNISRVFLVASEGDSTPAVVIAAGITVTILLGATVIAALPNIRTSSLIVGMAGVMLFVLLAGSLVLGASLPKSESAAGYVEPAGPAVNTLEVDALPELKFQAKKFDVPAGINLVKYNDKGGTHTLVFDASAVAVPGFELAVPVGKNAAKVDFVEGKTYVIYCTLPGHRAAGMEADVVVGAPGGTPEAGTQNPTETTVPAGTTPSTVPGGSSNTDPASQSSTGS